MLQRKHHGKVALLSAQVPALEAVEHIPMIWIDNGYVWRKNLDNKMSHMNVAKQLLENETAVPRVLKAVFVHHTKLANEKSLNFNRPVKNCLDVCFEFLSLLIFLKRSTLKFKVVNTNIVERKGHNRIISKV